MPIYAYRCQSCGATTEHIQKFSDPPMEECEACKGRLERAVTAAAFHLKGGGWYKDGYASTKSETGGEGGGGGGGEGSSGEAKSSETKSDSKPAEAASKPAADSAASKPSPKAAAE